MKFIRILPIIIIFFSIVACPRVQAKVPSKLIGRILLDVERRGQAWYVNPQDSKRYFLGRPADAFNAMRLLGIGIKNSQLAQIESSDRDKARGPIAAGISIASQTGQTATATLAVQDKSAASRLSGRILLQVENKGEAWYVNPADKKRYYLGRPEDAFRIMRELSLGINRENLAFIHKPGSSESLDQYSKYEHKKISTIDGEFTIDIVEIDLANPKLKIITDTADGHNCKKNCQAKSLMKYVNESKAFAAINATYFCSSGGCGAYNYYFYPVYNSGLGKLINDDQLKYWTTGPIIAFDRNNKFYYFKDSREFKSVDYFEKTNGVKLQAAIGNKPRLIQDYMNYLIDWELDDKQMKGKYLRNAIAYKDNKIYLVVAYNATIPNLANVMKALGVQYALNLDGGYSAALYYNDEYMVGPGRNIPNAILFSQE